MTSELEGMWKEVTAEMPENVSSVWWTKLLEKYSEDGRSYHNVEDLADKFRHFKSIKGVLKNQTAMSFALFFQYFEYDPKSVDCEEKNVNYFEQFANEGAIPKDSGLRAEVIGLLRSAATHSTDEHKTGGAYGNEDRHYFLDMDMAALGSSPEQYAAYTTRVQQEYAFLPDAMYKSLRLKVLQNFIQIPNIYASKEFREKFEEQARTNIQTEVKALMS